nr:MAG TPA: hypothetical protein [Caudoviricetes sp.]
MKYLMSEFLLAEDVEKFMREHEGGEFLDEILLDGFTERRFPDGIDALVCYREDVCWYPTSRFGEVITVEKSEA